MRRPTISICCALAAACSKQQPPPMPAFPVVAIAPDAAPAVAARRSCTARTTDTTSAPIAGTAWHVTLGPSTGAFGIDTDDADGLIVARLQGGRTVSIEPDTGETCAVLLQGPNTVGAIDPYSARSTVAHGLLVGPSRFGIAAVDVRTAAIRWHRDPIAANEDEYALRDGLYVVSTTPAVVVGFHVRHREGDSFRFEEIVAALDPQTGADLWRKTIVDHKRGEPLSMDGTVRLVGTGARVYVRTAGKLSALDAATGNEAWATTWTPSPPQIGPPTPARLAPLVAADDRHVAIAFPNRVELHDARSGARTGEVTVAGVATELVARHGIVYAALEATPGTTSVAAIDASTGKLAWTHDAAHSIRRLRVDDELVYLLDGNARVWGLELATGAPRFGLNTTSFDFAVVRSSAKAPRIIVPLTGLAAYDPAPKAMPDPLEPFARWELESRAGVCYPRALSWVDGNDHVVWERAVPSRVRALSFGACNEQEVSYARRSPRSNMIYVHVDMPANVIIAEPSGVLALRKTDGAVLLDAAAATTGDSVFFDNGTFELVGLPACKGSATHARVFARCGAHLVYFNGSTVLVIATDSWRVEARGTYVYNTTMTVGVQTQLSIAVGPYRLALAGVTYMQ